MWPLALCVMAGLSAEEMLQLAEPARAPLPPESVLALRVPSHQRAKRFSVRRRFLKDRRTVNCKRETAIAEYYNSHGYAKTSDFQMSGGLRPCPRGRSVAEKTEARRRSKKINAGRPRWTPECVLKTAGGSSTAPGRSLSYNIV